MGGLQLSNAQGFGDQPFAGVDRAAVRVKLMPLLSSQLEVDTLELDGLRLNLAKSQSGQTNWDDLVQGETPKAGPKAGQSAGAGLAGFTIGGVAINNARIDWDDRSTGQRYTLEQFSLNTGEISPDRPVSLDLGMTLRSAAPEVVAKVALTGQVNLDQAAGQLQVNGLVLKVEAQGAALQGRTAQAELMVDLGLGLDGQTFSVSDLKLSSGELNLSGQLSGKNLTSNPAISGSLKLAEFNLRQWLEGQGMAVPETADPQVLTRVGVSLVLAAEGGATQVNNLQLVLDDTKTTGNASVKGEAIAFRLDLDAIDLDRYLPPKKAALAPGEASGKGAATSGDEPLLPLDTLRALNLTGSLKVGRLVINKLKLEQVEIAIVAKNGKLTLEQKVGAFYQGHYQGKVDLNVTGKTPVMGITSKATDIQAGPLLVDLTGADKLSGRGNFNARLNARGNSVNALKRRLAGNLNFRFEDGAVKGVNLAQTIREAEARFKGQSVPKSEQPQQTDFSELSGSGVIKQGVLTNNDLLAKSPYLRVTGSGRVNLVAENLDYLVKTVIVSTAGGQGGVGLEELKGVPIPVRLTGPYASPDYSIEWGDVLVGTQKAKLEAKKEEVEEQLKSKLQEKLRGFFR
jgi:AsmA protein